MVEEITEDPLEKFKRLMIENNQKLLDEYQAGFMKLLDDFGKQLEPSLDFLANLTHAQSNVEALGKEIHDYKLKIMELTSELERKNLELKQNNILHEIDLQTAQSIIRRQEIQLEDLRKVKDLLEDAKDEELSKKIQNFEISTSQDLASLNVGDFAGKIADRQKKVDFIQDYIHKNGDSVVSIDDITNMMNQMNTDLQQDQDTLTGMVSAKLAGNLPITTALPNTLRINAQIGQITGEICRNNKKIEHAISQDQISSYLAQNLKLIEQILVLNPEMVMAAVEEKHMMEQKKEEEEKLVKKVKKPASTTTIPKCANPTFQDLLHSKPKKTSATEPKAHMTIPKAPPAEPKAPAPVAKALAHLPKRLPHSEYLKKSSELRREIDKLTREQEGLVDTIERLSDDSDPEFLGLLEDNKAFLDANIKKLTGELISLESAQAPPLDPKTAVSSSGKPQEASQDSGLGLGSAKPKSSEPTSSAIKKELNAAQRTIIVFQDQLRASKAENLELKARIARLEAESGLRDKESAKSEQELVENIFGDTTLIDDDDERYIPFDNFIAAEQALVHQIAVLKADTKARKEAAKENEENKENKENEEQPLSKPASVDSDGWKELVVGEKDDI